MLDKTSEGQKIRDFARKYADSVGEYNDRYTRLSKNYNEKQISKEMANDIIGEYLFTDEDLVSKLATEHPNTFQKIYYWFQHIFKLAKSGSKEARQLEQVRYNLEKGLAKINVEKSSKMEYDKATNEYLNALQKSSELARKLFPKDITVDDLINDDNRKGKFKEHSDSVEYFKLDYNVMQEINAIFSTKAHKSVSGDTLSFTQKIGANNQTYTIYADVLSDDIYNITNAEPLREDVVQDVNERIEKQNNESFIENEGYEQGKSSLDIESNERGRRTEKISGVSREQQGKIDNSTVNQKSTRDIRKELDNSSFSLSEQLENNLEKTLFHAENERQGMIDLFQLIYRRK